MPPQLSPLDIFRTLDKYEVRYIVIGGYAAYLQGSPFPTEDADITPESSAANLKRLSRALTALNARVRSQDEPDGLPFSHTGQSLATVGVWNLVTNYGDLDLSFVPSGTKGYGDLSSNMLVVTIRGVDIPLADLADIVRSKQAANRPKDQRVLPTLRQILAERQTREKL